MKISNKVDKHDSAKKITIEFFLPKLGESINKRETAIAGTFPK